MKHFSSTSVSIKSDDQTMVGTLFIPDHNKNEKLPSVVIYHGRGSSQKRYIDRAQHLAEHGIVALIFSFRGCGDSDGDFAEQTIVNGYHDALAGFDYLMSQNITDRERVGVWGGSYGGYQATLVSKARDFKSLLLSVPANYKDKWWDIVPESVLGDEKEAFRKSDDFFDTKAIKAIERWQKPLMVIIHENDDILPEKLTMNYYHAAKNASKKELRVIKNAPHALYDEKFRQESNRITTEWFLETL
jgi:dipeptidyl aminopeptidase/acylaminoacyl peptidase